MSLLPILAVSSQLHSILIGALIIFILILLIAGLLWCTERWINPVPPIAKLILALIILVCIVIWAFGVMGISI
jgi:hypothetical protein